MNSSNAIKLVAVGAVMTLVSGIFSSQLWAQPVYRIVGPDGKVTFSDQPPPATSKAKVSAAPGDSARGAASASLPFELRRVAGQYPVTLYTGENCGPCASARSLLGTRGIPFTERTVITSEDSQALQRISGDTIVPFLTIGSQQLRGFSDIEWTQFLDAAGYPKTSQLPAGYQQLPPSPLVTVAPVAPANTSAARPAARARPPSTEETPVAPPAASNPSGIRF